MKLFPVGFFFFFVPVILCLTVTSAAAAMGTTLLSASNGTSSISPLLLSGSYQHRSNTTTGDGDETRKTPDDKLRPTLVINIDDELMQQTQHNSSNTTNATTAINDHEPSQSKSLHSKVLLLCSVNSIRFWSPTCSIHESRTLSSLNRPSLLNYGISSVAVLQPLKAPNQLFWYDVHQHQLHHATLYQAHHSDCDSLVAIDSNRTLTLDSNPHFRPKDKMVKLAIDSAQHVLFASYFLQNRTDLYRIREDVDSQTQVAWLGSVVAERPNDVLVDENLQLAFWIEGWTRICRLDYRNMSNLSKVCSEELGTWNEEENRTERIYALEIDPHEHQLVWAEANGHIYRGPYHRPANKSLVYIFHTKFNSDRIVSLELLEPYRLIASSGDGTRFYEIDLGTQTHRLVLAESSAIFDMHLVEMPPPLPSIVTMAPPSSTTTTTSSSTSLPPSSTSASVPVPGEPSNPSPFVSNTTEHGEVSTTDEDSEVTLWFYLIMFFALLVSFLLVVHHIRRAREPFYSHLPSANLSNSFHRILTVPCSVFQGRTRTESSDRQELCRSPGTADDVVNVPDPSSPVHLHTPPTRYQRNLLRHSHTPARDIEDILARPVPSNLPPNCLACRDPDICLDKGICMVTYRVH